ncbi:nonsense-mediated mRNA decay factor SMG5-like [Oppia nitens]|uniref:nonsense-mediated mRNA decay factor SMG5-like n=1 Tax=Oppia nitens TaxID=1686743 RepID=UPI0023DB499A|nr:nonsense-mediated mRNA decay factor SMG5-like [Oppia nitens]
MMKRSSRSTTNTRLMREVVEMGRQLESAIVSADSLRNVFTDNIVKSRDRFKDLCEDILYSSGSEFGRKAEDLLWKRCFHDLMQFYKQNKKRMTSPEVSLLRSHLTTGFGLYYNILIGISKQYSVDIQCLMPYLITEQSIEDMGGDRLIMNEETKTWAQNAIHRILVCMGDLARYLFDLEAQEYRQLAIRFYDLALILNSNIGMPFNQLGTLSETNNYGLDSVYYYIRCLMCDKPFEGAESNMKRLFENNEKLLNEMKSNTETSDESFMIIKQSIVFFLKLCNDIWFFKESDNHFTQNIVSLFQQTLHSLKLSFNLQSKLTTEQMPTYMTPTTTFEMSVILLLIINRVQQIEINKSPLNGNQLLSFILTFLVNYLMTIVSSSHQNLKNKLGLNPFNSMNEVLNTTPKVSKENTPDLSPRRVLSRLRRRKAAINYEDKNALSIDDDDSELSELEETALSTIDVLEIGSDLSDSNDDSDSYGLDVTIVSSDDENPLPQKLNAMKTINTPLMPSEDMLIYIINESFLPTIKVIVEWLRYNPNTLTLISDEFQLCLEEFINFINTLITIEQKILQRFPNLLELKCFEVNWKQKYPLDSDLNLSNVDCLKTMFDSICFDIKKSLNNNEKGFLCIESLIAFTHYLCDANNCQNVYGISYDMNDKRFLYTNYSNGTHYNVFSNNTWSDNSNFISLNQKPINTLANNGLVNESKTNLTNNDDKKVMRNMAHLWLKAEVNQLEKDVKYSSQLPPYMVLDSSAYCQHLDFVKDLTHSKRFIIIVPKIVLSALDQLKKTNANAREAIRWLEEQLQRGSRVLRYPKDTEKLNLSPIKYPKRKDKEAIDYYELLEYCNYLNKNTRTQRNITSGIPMVSVLTHSFDRWPTNAEAVALSAGIHIETVDSFIIKWQNSIKTMT